MPYAISAAIWSSRRKAEPGWLAHRRSRYPAQRMVRIWQASGDVLLWIKAVPGASRDQIAGSLGDRLKVRITAAPAAGSANRAICRLIAHALGIKPRQVTIESGLTSPEKIVRLHDVTLSVASRRLNVKG